MSDLVGNPVDWFSRIAAHILLGLFLHPKLGPVFVQIFPNWLKKFPINQKLSQLAEKSKFKNIYFFPIWLKIAFPPEPPPPPPPQKKKNIYIKILLFFSQITLFFFSKFQWTRYQKFPKKVRKSPGTLLRPTFNYA